MCYETLTWPKAVELVLQQWNFTILAKGRCVSVAQWNFTILAKGRQESTVYACAATARPRREKQKPRRRRRKAKMATIKWDDGVSVKHLL